MNKESSGGMTAGAVYVQTNEPDNHVLGFTRAADGALTPAGSTATGGKGDGVAHLTSQGSVILTQDGQHLLVTNAASDDLSVFTVGMSGLSVVDVVATGAQPKSVTEHAGLVYVLNTGTPGVTGFRFIDGRLAPIAGSERVLAMNADPAQVGFSPDGSTLIVTQRGTDSITSFAVGMDGLLGEPQSHPSSGPTPYGFAFASDGTLVVTEAFRAEKGAAAASTYSVASGSVTPISTSVGNGRSEICWAVVSKDDRHVFTTNFADGAVSRYGIDLDGFLSLEDAVAGTAVEGVTGLRDEDLTVDGRFLYAIDADGGWIYGWSVGDAGELSAIGSWEGIPASVAGLAAS
ncbi:MAG: lactonase family protein [Actinomycetota bacterium]